MLFAMISNAGYYMTSGISSYYFNSVAGDLNLQSKFNMFGAVGSVIGIAVIPICSKLNMNNRNIYKLSLGMAAVGYIGMAVIGYGFGGNSSISVFHNLFILSLLVWLHIRIPGTTRPDRAYS